jgi:hypothetical protein
MSDKPDPKVVIYSPELAEQYREVQRRLEEVKKQKESEIEQERIVYTFPFNDPPIVDEVPYKPKDKDKGKVQNTNG